MRSASSMSTVPVSCRCWAAMRSKSGPDSVFLKGRVVRPSGSAGEHVSGEVDMCRLWICAPRDVALFSHSDGNRPAVEAVAQRDNHYRCRVSDLPQTDSPATSDAPELTFADLGLSPQVMKALADVGYESPSAIQAQT